jgi:hypothetical protein
MSTALTDDELVALALIRNTAWLAPLPTVDVGDADALLAAAPRGIRSLVTRGLMSAGRGLDPTPSVDLIATLEPAFAGRLVLSTFVAQRDLAFVPEGATSAIYARDDETALVEAISAGGVHYFSEMRMNEAVSAVGEFVNGVIGDGVTVRIDDGEPIEDQLVLCVAAAPSSPSLMAVTGRGTLGLVEVDADGVVSEVETPDTIGEVLERLLRHGGS